MRTIALCWWCILFFVNTVLCEKALAQERYSINGVLIIDQGDCNGARLTVSAKSSDIVIDLNKDGTFQTQIDWNILVYFKFEKKGYVTKIIEFSTVVPATAHRNYIEPYNLKVRLFKQFEGVDTVFFKNPVAKIRFDNQVNDFEYDMDYSMQVKYQIDKMGHKEVKDLDGSHTEKVNKPTSATTNQIILKENDMVSNSQLNKTLEVTTLPEKKVKEAPCTTNMPPLKAYYPEGITTEFFQLDRKEVTRIIIKKGSLQKVYFKVKHFWGSEYYFLDESPFSTTCITRKAYEIGVKY